MELKHMVIAIAAVFSASAFAAGDPAKQQRPSQSQSQAGPQAQSQHSPEVVKQVQQQLKQKGINAGPVDGQWGPQTQQGVKQFQEKEKIQASGQLDQETLSALGIQEGSSALGSGSASGGAAAGGAEAGGSASGSGSSSGAGGSAGGAAGSDRGASSGEAESKQPK
jgi:peptidoglycan hydrolase-like protein with peptidoglycan-binding domain